MEIKDRIKSMRRVKAKDIRPNPRNWRTHPEAQQNALRGLLAEIGIVDVLYQNSIFKARNLAEAPYSRAWYPAEGTPPGRPDRNPK